MGLTAVIVAYPCTVSTVPTVLVPTVPTVIIRRYDMLRDLCGQRRTHRRHLASEVSTAESGFLHRHRGVRERASIIAWNLESRSNTRQLQNGESRSRAYKQKLSEVKTIINDATSEVLV